MDSLRRADIRADIRIFLRSSLDMLNKKSLKGVPYTIPSKIPMRSPFAKFFRSAIFTDFPGKLSEDLSQEKSIEFSKDSWKDVL